MRLRVEGPVRYALLPELAEPGKRLGRHIMHDERSHNFPAQTARALKSVSHSAQGLPLDQADVGSCTGEALTGAGNSTPDLKSGEPVRTQDDAYRVYHEETELEGQPWPPNDPGGSGLMVCRAGKKLGWVKGYRHAFGLEHALRSLVLRPQIWGIPWYDSFDRPNAEGIVDLPSSARIRGGHEICALKLVVEHELVGFAQSWGDGWGVPDPEIGLTAGGAFYMPFAVLDELLAQQGDVTVPYFV